MSVQLSRTLLHRRTPRCKRPNLRKTIRAQVSQLELMERIPLSVHPNKDSRMRV